MTITLDTPVSGVAPRATVSIDTLELRFGAVFTGLFDRVVDEDSDWFLVDHAGHLVDGSAHAVNASSLLGSTVTNIAGLVAHDMLVAAWSQVLLGRAQAVWPWRGGRARAAMRSIELHPIRDTLSDGSPVIGALAVIVDFGDHHDDVSLAA